ncbi:HD domain-containing protein [Candidatus Desantisbacteria bacterium]|nr:HD domain-containing protein [Candidatus Desantisbacteria bacterium]
MNTRFQKQINFILEIDKLKTIFRKTRLLDNSRYENSAEHGWYMAIMAILLLEYSKESNIDILKVIKMALIHDIVEIDAGDTYLYDSESQKNKSQKEKKAAKRIFGILPDDQRDEFIILWNEFEEKKTKEAKFAAVLDRIGPLIQNYHTKGCEWKKNSIKSSQVYSANQHIEQGSTELWNFARQIIDDSVKKGYLVK